MNEMGERTRYSAGGTLSMLLLVLGAFVSTYADVQPRWRQVIDRLRAPPTKERRPRDHLSLRERFEILSPVYVSC